MGIITYHCQNARNRAATHMRERPIHYFLWLSSPRRIWESLVNVVVTIDHVSNWKQIGGETDENRGGSCSREAEEEQ